MDYLLIISYFTLLLWLYLFLAHGKYLFFSGSNFWCNEIIFKNIFITKNKKDISSKVCVIIPARNEQNNIFKTLNSIKDQKLKYIDIIVVDDNSEDKTSSLVKKFKKTFKNTFLLRGRKLPTGWVGKTWALKQGVDFANKKKFDYYIFIDSDIILKNNLLKNAIYFIEKNNLLMVSLMAKLNCRSFWEKLLIPPFIYFFQKIYPFNLVNTKDSKVSAAAGGFILCKASIFKKENLYNQIKNKLIDDCNIAKLFKKKGNIWLGLTNEVVSGRKYNNLQSIWKMVSRTAFEQLNYSLVLLFLSLFGLFLIYMFPISLIFLAPVFFSVDNIFIHLLMINICSFIIMTIVFSPTLKFFKMKRFFALTLPFSALLYGIMTTSSAMNYFLSGGNVWKGRRY